MLCTVRQKFGRNRISKMGLINEFLHTQKRKLVFEIFDEDGSGTIDFPEVHNTMRQPGVFQLI